MEIEKGKEIPIVVYYGDDAEDLANDLAFKYRLSPQATLKLKENIQLNINKALYNFHPRTRSEQTLNTDFSVRRQLQYNNSATKQNFLGDANLMKANTPMCRDKNLSHIRSAAKIAVKFSQINNSRSALETSNKGRVTPDLANSIQRLYLHAVNRKKEMEKLNEMRKKAKEVENQQWSFKPTINSFSKKLASSNQNHNRVEARLISKEKSLLEKIASIRNSKEAQEKLNCPFRPTINKRSTKLVNSRNQQISSSLGIVTTPSTKFNYLFEDAKRRMILQANSSKYLQNHECTFHPSINHSQRTSKTPSQHKKFEQKTNGEQLYHPKTGRPPKKGRNENKDPIGTYLYLEGQRRASLKSILRKKETKEECKIHNKSFVQEESKKLMKNRKRLIIEKIFKDLDQDLDGFITTGDIHFAGMWL